MNLKKNYSIPANFKLDDKGLSPAFFIKKKLLTIKKNEINFLKKFYKHHFTDVRLCLHQDYNEELQSMINLISQKDFYTVHCHQFSSEYYQVIEGSLKLIYFDKDLKFENSVILPKQSIFGKVKKKQFHIAIPISKICIYHEYRAGNFKKHKNFFTNKKISLKEALIL